MPSWARLLPLLVVVSASSLASSTDRIIGIGVGTFIMAVTALVAVLACVGARGTLHWKYEPRWSYAFTCSSKLYDLLCPRVVFFLGLLLNGLVLLILWLLPRKSAEEAAAAPATFAEVRL